MRWSLQKRLDCIYEKLAELCYPLVFVVLIGESTALTYGTDSRASTSQRNKKLTLGLPPPRLRPAGAPPRPARGKKCWPLCFGEGISNRYAESRNSAILHRDWGIGHFVDTPPNAIRHDGIRRDGSRRSRLTCRMQELDRPTKFLRSNQGLANSRRRCDEEVAGEARFLWPLRGRGKNRACRVMKKPAPDDGVG